MADDESAGGERPLRRDYFSVRSGRRPAPGGFKLPQFAPIFIDAYGRLEHEGLFAEWLGQVDGEWNYFTPGKAGANVPLYVFRALRRDGLWPIESRIARYTEDDLFDMVEFLYDHASKPVYGEDVDETSYVAGFDAGAGRTRFRDVMNDILSDFGEGYEVSDRGELLSLGDRDMRPLLRAPLPIFDPENVESRVEDAKRKFLRQGSSGGERLDAVRGLADVLEFLRPNAKAVLRSADENDLFNLANNFGIRHHRADQKTDYDKAIWLSWMFHHNLATIHAFVRLIEKAKPGQ